MSTLSIQVNGTHLPIYKVIEQELEVQFEKRKLFEEMEAMGKFNKAYRDLEQIIINSCERVKNYYNIIDHHNQTIGVRKGKYNQFINQ